MLEEAERITREFQDDYLSTEHMLLALARGPGDVAAVLLVRPDDLEGLLARLGVGGVDHLLAELGELLHAQAGSNDIAARIDDYSFGLLLKRPQQEEIIRLAEVILNQISSHDFDGGKYIWIAPPKRPGDVTAYTRRF